MVSGQQPGFQTVQEIGPLQKCAQIVALKSDKVSAFQLLQFLCNLESSAKQGSKVKLIFQNNSQTISQLEQLSLATFPGMFGDIPRNITFPLFPAFPAFRSPFLYFWFYTQPGCNGYNIICNKKYYRTVQKISSKVITEDINVDTYPDGSQKQPSRGVNRKSCSENMQQIYRRTPMPMCDFNKVAKLFN